MESLFAFGNFLLIAGVQHIIFLSSIGITPLSGTTNEEHMAHDVAVETAPEFSPSEVEGLEAALRRASLQMG